MVESSQNIKPEEENKHSLKIKETILNSIHDDICLIKTDDLTLLDFNKAFLDKYGPSKEDIVGKYCYKIIHNRQEPCQPPNDICPCKETILRRATAHAEHVNFLADGTKSYVEITTSPIMDENGHVYQVVHAARDITNRKKTEEVIHNLLQNIEKKNDELERFTYTVSHDLKSPLITIRGFVGVLEESLGERIDDDIRQSLDYINSAATKMSSLLDDLLRLSRLGKFVNLNERVELSSVAEEALNLIKGRLLGEKIIVKIADDLPAVTGDRIRLCELMQNLLENAIKYMGEQPAPFIEVGVTEIDGERACFVRDNGKGILERYQAKVFGLFERVSTDGEGTGIGLSMVQRIIELHGGRVWVESTGVAGEGATFWFTLPWEDVQTGTPTS